MSVPLAKHLGSNDKKVRDRAVAGLAAFLSQDGIEALPEQEMKKLWKGIFYCYWMSDKPVVQQNLSSELAELLLKIQSHVVAFSFLRGFWESIVLDWSGIDRLRMDKYYMLVRKYVYASFLLLIRLEWNEDNCLQYNRILTDHGGPLCLDDPKVPLSLVYHLADIYMEELGKALQASQPCAPAVLPLLARPFVSILAATNSNITFSRINDSLLSPLLSGLLEAESREDNEEGLEHSSIRQRLVPGADYPFICSHVSSLPQTDADDPEVVRKSILQDIFKAASQSDTRDANRRKLYKLWKAGMVNSNEEIIELNAG